MKTTRRQAITGGLAISAAAMLPSISAAASASEQAAMKTEGSVKDTGKQALADAVSLSDFEAVAAKRMTHNAWEYINSGAADQITLRWNRESLDKIRLNPRVLRDTTALKTKVTLLGNEIPFPVILAPTALHKLAHPLGEIATAKGAGDANTLMTLSTMASTSLEDVAKAATHPLWFQLYVQSDRGFTANLVARAVAAGYKALVVTVDTPVEGARNRQERAKFHLPPGVALENLKGLEVRMMGGKLDTEHQVFENILPKKLTWKDIEWLQSLSKLPVVLKGVLNADDADIAARSGVGGIIVSNHGARNLDTVPATIDALPRVTDKVAGRMMVLMDGGVRRGTDVLKALALGANAVLVGRPIFYGLSTGGAAGVTKMLNILRTEFEMAMALSGVDSIEKIDRSVLWE
ncbi:MAG TPA: alpha-hydroxy acid oxidase [Terriglobales bacterium]|nr:alpha-hydroxy acid oxidase [Terriglobales bacterium]